MLNIIYQIILSIFLVLILAFIGYSIYNKEYYNALTINKNNVKSEITILDGYIDFKSQANITYNTQDPTIPSYINISPSINQKGGAEYCYNFWLYIDKTGLTDISDKVLLFKGSKVLTKYNYLQSGNCKAKDDYILVKNPLIRLSDNGSSLIIEYNTLTNIDAINGDGSTIGDNDICTSSKNNNNMLGVYDLDDATFNKKFFMVTLIIQEVTPNDDILSKNITNCKLYLNSTLVLDRNTNSPYNSSLGTTVMKTNKGKLYVAPTNIFNNDATLDTNKILLSDLKYFNYAIDINKIEKLYNNGFNYTTATIHSTNNNIDQYTKSPPLSKDYTTPKPY